MSEFRNRMPPWYAFLIYLILAGMNASWLANGWMPVRSLGFLALFVFVFAALVIGHVVLSVATHRTS
ncbi:MAG: hypothetical protein HYS44_02985 [Candidatus Niyogibacteria bacterium]|nr:hypothetical protein [Candidatus Niyogibacteria bacterium]